MHIDDPTRLGHMLQSANEAIGFADGKKRKELDGNRMLVLSLVKSIEIIGEAASGLSESVYERHPQIPWKKIVNMRHRLIHAYSDVNLDIVWSTVVNDLPPLIEELEKIVKSES